MADASGARPRPHASLLTRVCERILNIRHNEVDYNNAVERSCPFAGHLGHSARRVWLGARRVIVVGSRNGAHRPWMRMGRRAPE
jgi:hypothetical protein